LLALLGVHHFLYISRIRVNMEAENKKGKEQWFPPK